MHVYIDEFISPIDILIDVYMNITVYTSLVTRALCESAACGMTNTGQRSFRDS
jgi:hypothetical protein